jgi:hypothetical protein
VAGIVAKPEHYLYSSAKDYFETTKCGLLAKQAKLVFRLLHWLR